MTIQTYREFRPTGFDQCGVGPDAIQDMLVAPVSRSRDSGVPAESNWEVVTGGISAQIEGCQVHRFGHWACGWFELFLVPPSPEARDLLERWEGLLEDYPIASEEHYSNACVEAEVEAWDSYGREGWYDALCTEFGEAEIECLCEAGLDGDALWYDLAANGCGEAVDIDDYGVTFNYDAVLKDLYIGDLVRKTLPNADERALAELQARVNAAGEESEE